MYPNLDWMRKLLADPSEKRPVMMCEYAYAKGNSTGNFFKFWDMVDAYPRFQGGCIWDWNDKAILHTAPNGARYYAYGGDFGPDFDYQKHIQDNEDPQMCCNGIVGPNLEPHPGAYEVKKVQAPLSLSANSAQEALAGNFSLWNKHHTLSLGHLAIRWELLEDGAVVQTGKLPPIDLGAGQKTVLHVPYKLPALTPGAEYHLTMRFVLAKAVSWAPAGHEVYWEQFPLLLPVPAQNAVRRSSLPALHLEETAEFVTISGSGFSVRLGKARGTISSYQAGGELLLESGPEENYYRAPTDVDLLMGNESASIHKWRAAGIDQLLRELKSFRIVHAGSHDVEIHTSVFLHGAGQERGINSEITYRILGSGEIVLANTVEIDPRMPHLPRIGLELVLPAGYETFTWFGRGPHENYSDRKHGAAVGLYTSSVDDQFTPYIYTSEFGGKEDVRWLALTKPQGAGLLVAGLDLLHVDALHYAIHDLEQAGHPYELERLAQTILHLDGWHMGVGGDDGWAAPVHPEFLIQPGKYRFALRLLPLHQGDDPAAAARTRIEGVR